MRQVRQICKFSASVHADNTSLVVVMAHYE